MDGGDPRVLSKADVSKVLLVTSSYHMPRAVAIAHVMLGVAWR